MRTRTAIRAAALLRNLTILAGALAFSSQGTCRAQTFQFTPQCRKASDAILRFSFREAENCLQEEQQLHPSNLFPVYYRNFMDFLVLFTGEEKSRFDQLKPNRSERIDLLEKGDRSSPFYRYCLAEVNIQWAFVHVKFHEYATAALEFRKAYDLLLENHKRFPSFLPDENLLGLLHTLIGVIPENYKWLASLIGFRGTVEEGLQELSRLAGYRGDDPFCRSLVPYSSILVALIDANLRKDKQAALGVMDQFSDDPLLSPYAFCPPVVYTRVSIDLKTGRNAEALQIFSNYRPSADQMPFWFLSYLEGISLLNNLDTAASGRFRLFLAQFRGINYIKSSWQKIGWSYLLTGDTVSYRDAMQMVLTVGNREVDEDRQAWYEAESCRPPARPLLRARLLFDGGYYDRALDALLDISLKGYIRDGQDLAEYYYRLGRIYHETGQMDKAVRNYREAIATGARLPQYFAAGAALQLGMMFENEGQPRLADSCYRLCLGLPFKEYRASLGQKARAGLERTRGSR
jgi:tetratricopeptide (TPR) repeat protein